MTVTSSIHAVPIPTDEVARRQKRSSRTPGPPGSIWTAICCQLVLGRSLDTDRLEASYHDGVLTLSIPVAEKARARKITVTRADASASVDPRTIEGDPSETRAVGS